MVNQFTFYPDETEIILQKTVYKFLFQYGNVFQNVTPYLQDTPYHVDIQPNHVNKRN